MHIITVAGVVKYIIVYLTWLTKLKREHLFLLKCMSLHYVKYMVIIHHLIGIIPTGSIIKKWLFNV